jgi:hypothetical protein
MNPRNGRKDVLRVALFFKISSFSKSPLFQNHFFLKNLKNSRPCQPVHVRRRLMTKRKCYKRKFFVGTDHEPKYANQFKGFLRLFRINFFYGVFFGELRQGEARGAKLRRVKRLDTRSKRFNTHPKRLNNQPEKINTCPKVLTSCVKVLTF